MREDAGDMSGTGRGATRSAVLAEVGDLVALRRAALARPVLVCVDGVDGAGKTTFADELAAVLEERGERVVRASIDGFHHPRAHRHAAGRTAEAVWTRHFDLPALRRELLDPWRSGPGSAFRIVVHDVNTDAYVDTARRPVPEDGVLVVDGVFAQRPELADAWDLAIFLEVPFEVSVPRMAARDGTVDDVEHPDQRRYADAQRRYLTVCRPRTRADVVVDNADLDRPRIVAVRPPGPRPAG